MSTINFNRNSFLEKEELVNFQSFFSSKLLFDLIMSASATFGIVTNDPSKIKGGDSETPVGMKANSPFIVQEGSLTGSIKVLPGMALNELGQVINIGVEDNILVPNDALFYWVKIGYKTRNYEVGSVSINTQGFVSGTADFTGKVRGQATSTPTCIRFTNQDGTAPLNNGIYQVVNVVDSKNLRLTSSVAFVAEANLRPIVLGTLPIGGVFSSSQQSGLYLYDHYAISLIQEVSVATPPEKEPTEFYIARVKNSNGTFIIENDIKSEFWSLGNVKTITTGSISEPEPNPGPVAEPDLVANLNVEVACDGNVFCDRYHAV